MSRIGSEATNEILILGGGYAGMATAVNLARRTRKLDVRIRLVNPTDRFVERLRLHQAASGQELAQLRIPELLAGTGVEFVPGWVTAIDLERRTVRIDDDRMLGYNTLVYALGSVADTSAVAGADKHAYTLDSLLNAEALAARLARLEAGTVVVCGGGLTGVEAAAEIAEQHPGVRVMLLSRDEPAAMMGSKARAYVRDALSKLGVDVRAGVEVAKVLPTAVRLVGGEQITADVVLWTAGVRVSPLAANAGLAVDEYGRIVTDATLRSISHPEVYAVGDAAAVRQNYGVLHGTCGNGIPTGVHAAVTIARRLRGKEGKPFRFGYLHQPVSLGRRDAVIQFTKVDETPTRMVLTGKSAAVYKEAVSSSAWPAYRLMNRFSGTLWWRRGGRATRFAQ